MNLTYKEREIFWGNEALVIADLTAGDGGAVTVSAPKLVTGLVSVGAMEDQAETKNFPADNVPDHGVKKGATLLQGEVVFLQTDEALKEDWLGQVATPNGLGYVPTGNWKTKCVQYLIKGRRKTASGGFEDGWRIEVYPAMTPTAEATKESETDSVDGVDPIQWKLKVQAVDSELYKVAGSSTPFAEYEVWGAQAQAFATKMESGLFIMMPDTEISGGATLVAPGPLTATSATANIPTTLKNSLGADVTVTNVIKNSGGQIIENGSLTNGTFTVTFSASGYQSVTAQLTVTIA